MGGRGTYQRGGAGDGNGQFPYRSGKDKQGDGEGGSTLADDELASL